jgi:N-acetylmuramoyl-L-alanine amidase
MPSPLRAFVTLAGCAAVTLATLVVSAAPSAAGGAPFVFTPTHGTVGTQVDITTGIPPFANGSVKVEFGAASATVQGTVTDDSVSVDVPAKAVTGKITLVQGSTTATSITDFTVDSTAKPTSLGLVLTHRTVTYGHSIHATATIRSGGKVVKGQLLRLQHRVAGTSAWRSVSGTKAVRTGHLGRSVWTVRPKVGQSYRAVYAGTSAYTASTSAAKSMGVRPALHLSLPSTAQVLLPIKAHGTVSPHLSGRVLLERRTGQHWSVVARPAVHHGSFTSSLHPSVAGSQRYRVARAHDGTYLGSTSKSVVTHVTAPTLRYGSTGAVVAALQRRLGALHYDIGSKDGTYGWDSVHAVTAFEKVQGMSKDGVAGPSVFAALAHPKVAHLRHRIKTGTAVEVNIAKQILLISKNGKIWRILDTSTAGGYYYKDSEGQTAKAVTPTGHFTIQYKIDHLVHSKLGYLYRPSYFDYAGDAIHGEGDSNAGGDVPPYPNSHGCVRITDSAVDRYYSTFAVGTSVWIYG